MAATSLSEENMDIAKLKVPDLKRELKTRGLSTSGNKTDLMERLQSALKLKLDETASAESVDDLDDDLLNDDDLDHEQLDASESVLTELDEQFDTSPTTKTPKRKISDAKLSSSDSDSKPAKKIVLNREPSLPNESEEKEDNEDKSVSGSIKDEDCNDKKVVKLSELSAKERLEMRAKKFGAASSTTNTDAKKLARAERFSTDSSSGSLPTSTITPSESPNLDALKKRAERFGGSVSTVMSSVEQQERMERRKARFGVVTSTNGTSAQTDKAKQRLERFKTPVK